MGNGIYSMIMGMLYLTNGLDVNGAMYENCSTPDGYKVDETGAWVK
ncbi:hypothetical protein [Clostridium saccharoperbutylacetonicum]